MQVTSRFDADESHSWHQAIACFFFFFLERFRLLAICVEFGV
jgi:hypothetical protein